MSPSDPSDPELREALSHLIERRGSTEAQMVDVAGKDETDRAAEARARVVFPAGLLGRILAGEGPKGAIEEVARVAGIQAAKRTAELIPLCHPLGLDHVRVELRPDGDDALEVRCGTRCRGRTGVEMEAMVGVATAALTIYDMTKGADKGIRIESIELLSKSGGKSGAWSRGKPPAGGGGPPA